MADRLAIMPLAAYSPPIDYAIGALQWERQRTHQTVAQLSQQTLDALPKGTTNSIGSLLYHIALIELDWLYSEILEQEIPKRFYALFPHDVRDQEGQLSKVTGLNTETHLERLALVRETLLDELKGMTATDFYRLRSLPAYEVNPAWVLYHLLEHEAKHSEQIRQIGRELALT